MKRLFVIGNGFDLHHNLKTGYNDFRKYLEREEPKYFEFINNLILEYNPDFDSNDWSDIETELICVMGIDYDYLLDEAIASAETDMDRASYWNDIQFNAEYFNQDLPNFKESFDAWIDTINIAHTRKDMDICFLDSDNFLSFNYTKTLEKLYGIKEDSILHIHGQKGTDKVFGQSQYFEEPLPLSNLTQEDYDHGIEDDWRIEEAKEILNSIPALFYKDCKTIIKENKNYFLNMQRYDEIIFTGWKLGDQDKPYMEEILSNISTTSKISVVYHKEDNISRNTYEDYFCRWRISPHKVSYYTWEQIDLLFNEN